MSTFTTKNGVNITFENNVVMLPAGAPPLLTIDDDGNLTDITLTNSTISPNLDQEPENKELKKELLNQWGWNHAEHCTNTWPHAGICHWPLPEIIKNDPIVYTLNTK